jgi:hypothetical protein
MFTHSSHEQTIGKLYHLRLRVECTLFCNLLSGVRTHAVVVIGLYEFEFWCLTPLSAIFQLYQGDQF